MTSRVEPHLPTRGDDTDGAHTLTVLTHLPDGKNGTGRGPRTYRARVGLQVSKGVGETRVSRS